MVSSPWDPRVPPGLVCLHVRELVQTVSGRTGSDGRHGAGAERPVQPSTSPPHPPRRLVNPALEYLTVLSLSLTLVSVRVSAPATKSPHFINEEADSEGGTCPGLGRDPMPGLSLCPENPSHVAPGLGLPGEGRREVVSATDGPASAVPTAPRPPVSSLKGLVPRQAPRPPGPVPPRQNPPHTVLPPPRWGSSALVSL